jgi:hypothetical protein
MMKEIGPIMKQAVEVEFVFAPDVLSDDAFRLIYEADLARVDRPSGTVRVFGRNSHPRMPLSFTPLLRVKRCHACDR